MALGVLILALVTAERLGELVIARRNTRRLLAAGGYETGASHYPLIVSVHAAWLAGLWVLAPGETVRWEFLLVFLVLQALRLWVLATLGPRWTTRIIIVPGETLVTAGPYRYVAHPNYVVVIGEIACLPLVFGLTGFALLFTLLNGAVLCVRIRAESAALRGGRSRDDG